LLRQLHLFRPPACGERAAAGRHPRRAGCDVIAWTPGTSMIRVGPLIPSGADTDWTEHPVRYWCTGGAAFTALRECTDRTLRDMMLFIEFHRIVVRDKVPVDAAHEAFLAIDEYRERVTQYEEASLTGWIDA
jgi:hypothetical protein